MKTETRPVSEVTEMDDDSSEEETMHRSELDRFLQPHVNEQFPTVDDVLANLTLMMMGPGEMQSPKHGSCPPSTEGVGAIKGKIVPRNERLQKSPIVTMQSGEEEQAGITSTPKMGKESEARASYLEINRRISPLAPRVDTWRGPSQVCRVPSKEYDNQTNKTTSSLKGEMRRVEVEQMMEEILERVLDEVETRSQGDDPKVPSEEVLPNYATSESDNCSSHGTGTGLTMSTPDFSPLAPRVDTWRGLENVSSVPRNVIAQIKSAYQGDPSSSEEEERSHGRLEQIAFNYKVDDSKEWWSFSDGYKHSPETERWREKQEEKEAVRQDGGFQGLAGPQDVVEENITDDTDLSPTCFKVSTESDNLRGRGADQGPTQSAQRNSPHDPRVDTWRGLSEVNIVPTLCRAPAKVMEQEQTEQTQMRPEGESRGERRCGPGRAGKTSSHSSHTAPVSPVSKSVESRSTQPHTDSKIRRYIIAKRRRFFARRKKRRQQARQIQKGTQILKTAEQSKSKVRRKLSFCENLRKGKPTRVNFIEISEMSTSANSSNMSTLSQEDPAEKNLSGIIKQMDTEDEKSVVETKNDEKDEGKLDERKETGGAKQRKPRKVHKCEVTECNFEAKVKAKFEKHLAEKHGLNKTSPNTSGLLVSSSETSPALNDSKNRPKRKRKSEEIEQSRELRAKLEQLESEARKVDNKGEQEGEEEGKKDAKAKSTVKEPTIVDQLLEEQKKTRKLEKLLSRQVQLTEEVKAKSAVVEEERDEYFAEMEQWRKQASTLIQTAKLIKDPKEKKKELEDLKAEKDRWENMARLQTSTLATATIQVREAKDKLKQMEKRTVCRDYSKGNCRRIDCRFAHVLPTSKVEEKPKKQETEVKMILGPQGSNDTNTNVVAVVENIGNRCIHYERGYCSYGQQCKKEHRNELYNTRPRSASEGQKGFQGRPKKKQGNLGTLVEESPALPKMSKPVMDAASALEEIKTLDAKAKGPHSAAEKMVLDQLRELKVLVGLTGNPDELSAAFRSKQE